MDKTMYRLDLWVEGAWFLGPYLTWERLQQFQQKLSGLNYPFVHWRIVKRELVDSSCDELGETEHGG